MLSEILKPRDGGPDVVQVYKQSLTDKVVDYSNLSATAEMKMENQQRSRMKSSEKVGRSQLASMCCDTTANTKSGTGTANTTVYQDMISGFSTAAMLDNNVINECQNSENNTIQSPTVNETKMPISGPS